MIFRRKADTLPTFVGSTVDHHDMDHKKKVAGKPSIFSAARLLYALVFGCFCYMIYEFSSSTDWRDKYDEFNGYVMSDFEIVEENETMEDIMKRHPYNLKPDGGNKELKYASTILRDRTRPPVGENDYGNMIVFSLHGRVASESLLTALHEQYGFQNGGDFDLDNINTDTMPDDAEWGHHDASENSQRWQSSILERIETTFKGYGSFDFRRKIVHVRMADAWKNDVSITWLMEALRDVGGVTHMVVLIRNPLRAKISDIASTRYEHVITPSLSCEDQIYLYDIGRSEAIEMAVSQHAGVREALAVGGLKSMGVTFEHDIKPNFLTTLHNIANFLWDPTSGHLIAPVEVVPRFDLAQHGECSLDNLIHNFKELECMLRNTALSWIVDPENTYTFDRIMQLGDEFKSWVDNDHEGSKAKKLLNPAICRVKANHAEVQASTLALRKHSRRCGHGGHTPVCAGYGPMKSFMCSRLLALTNGQCDSFTYTNGNCYLHDETKLDYWEGDCESTAVSFLAYLRFPDDR